MLVTVAICTWNRCLLLEQGLQSLTAVRVPPGVDWRIVVIDNNCTDRTAEVVEPFIERLPLRRVLEPVAGLSHARNRALAEATGDVIAFLDDDARVSEQWLDALTDSVRRRPDGVAFGGPVDPWFPHEPDPDLVAAYPALGQGFCGLDLGTEERTLGPDEYTWGVNTAFRRAMIGDLTFDVRLGHAAGSLRGGEDRQFTQVLRERGHRAYWVPPMAVRHWVDPSRMTKKYLRRFTIDRGLDGVFFHGVLPGRTLFGVPRWLVREALADAGRWVRHAATGSRRERLMGEALFYRRVGQIKASWALRHDRHRPEQLREDA